MILDRSRGLRAGESTEIVGLHRPRLLVMDEIGLITTLNTFVLRTAVNEIESKIGIGVFLPRVGCLRLRLYLVLGRDGGTDLHRRISRDVKRPCTRGEKMHKSRLLKIEMQEGQNVCFFRLCCID